MSKRETTDTIVIHCTQTPPDMDVDVEKVTQWHKERGFDTIGYHYLIKRDGTLQEGRQQDEVGAHAVAVNGNSVGVAMAGGGTSSMGWEDNFAPIQFQTLKTIIMKLKKDYEIKKIIGHYQVDDKKECPSFDVPKWLKKKTNLQEETIMETVKKYIKMAKDNKKIVMGIAVVIIIIIAVIN